MDTIEQTAHDPAELQAQSERIAAYYLRRKDYEILEKGFTCRYGTMEIIARDSDDDTLVFCTVRGNRSIDAAVPSDTRLLQKRAEQIAMTYLSMQDAEYNCRFDSIAVCITRNDRAFIRHAVGIYNGNTSEN